MYKREYEFTNSSLFTRMHCILVKSDLTRVHCATFYQSALWRHGLHEDVTPSSSVDSSERGLMVQYVNVFKFGQIMA